MIAADEDCKLATSAKLKVVSALLRQAAEGTFYVVFNSGGHSLVGRKWGFLLSLAKAEIQWN